MKTDPLKLIRYFAICILCLGTLGQSAVHGQSKSATTANRGLSLNVRDFGATGNGQTKDTAAIQQAIDRAYVLGGGEVLVPAGNYLTGAWLTVFRFIRTGRFRGSRSSTSRVPRRKASASRI